MQSCSSFIVFPIGDMTGTVDDHLDTSFRFQRLRLELFLRFLSWTNTIKPFLPYLTDIFISYGKLRHMIYIGRALNEFARWQFAQTEWVKIKWLKFVLSQIEF